MAIDPICQMTVDESTDLTAEREGETFYFCSPGCRDAFLRGDEPGSHSCCHSLPIIELGGGPASMPDSDAAYLCPMCPGVEQEEAGICWKCGMALEPNPRRMPRARTVFTCSNHPNVAEDEAGACPVCNSELVAETRCGDDSPDPELIDMRRRFGVAMLFTIPVFLLAMLPMIGIPLPEWIGSSRSNWLQLACSLPVVFWAGRPFLERGLQSLRTRSLNMFTLIMIGVLSAFAFSLVGLLGADLLPASLKESGQPPLYFEAAAVIITLVLLGQILELGARQKTGNAIRALMTLTPPTALRIEDSAEQEVPVDQLRKQDIVRVRPGCRIPLDGIVTEGSGSVDESMLTGESNSADKRIGDAVIGGTINQSGSFTMRITHLGDESVLAGIVRLVAEAQLSRAPIQKVADRAAAWFVPVVILLSVATAAFWIVFRPVEPASIFALVNAIAVLMIACPCALGLATPMSITVGVGRGAGAGVLIRNASILERMDGIDRVLVDKTGTVTEGRPSLTTVHVSPDLDRDRILGLAVALERLSEHPIGLAIAGAAVETKGSLQVENFSTSDGPGITGTIAGQVIRIGAECFLHDADLKIPTDLSQSAANQRKSGETVVLMAVDDRVCGMFGVSDAIKPEAKRAITRLQQTGVQVIMLTGDNATTAARVADELGITEVHAGLRPEDKIAHVKSLKNAGHRVAMAGDGINDAPALAEADVGIAMGSGTDIAMQTADITLVKGDLNGIARARLLSHLVMRNIRQNLFFAFAYNATGIPIAAGLLMPWGFSLNPMIAAAAMSLSSVSVISNSLRLRSARLD